MLTRAATIARLFKIEQELYTEDLAKRKKDDILWHIMEMRDKIKELKQALAKD